MKKSEALRALELAKCAIELEILVLPLAAQTHYRVAIDWINKAVLEMELAQ